MQVRSLRRQTGLPTPIHVSFYHVYEIQRTGFIRDHHKAKAFATFMNRCLFLGISPNLHLATGRQPNAGLYGYLNRWGMNTNLGRVACGHLVRMTDPKNLKQQIR